MSKEPFVTVYRALYGYKSVLMVWTEDEELEGGYWEPWNTGYFQYETVAEAAVEARQWAESEEVRYVPYEE